MSTLPMPSATPAPHTAPAPREPVRPLTWLLLALIIAGAVAASLYWVQTNIVLVGRDSAGHLEQSLLVGRALGAGGLQGIFRALTLDDYRPPALYLATQIPYALFGATQDSAQATNVVLLALILLLTFLLARRVLPQGWSLVATLITALLPMMAAMSRLYYMENLLTAALLANLLALLESRGF
ncbi:MAG: glycosyltransferase family 39 protein, partial [Caldilineaceae bacterium]